MRRIRGSCRKCFRFAICLAALPCRIETARSAPSIWNRVRPIDRIGAADSPFRETKATKIAIPQLPEPARLHAIETESRLDNNLKSLQRLYREALVNGRPAEAEQIRRAVAGFAD